MSLSSSRIVPSADAFAINPAQSGGLSLRVQGGYLLGGMAYLSVANVHLTLTDNATTYVEVSPVGRITSNTTSFTNGAIFLYVVSTLNGVVVSIADWRASPAVPSEGLGIKHASVTLADDDLKALGAAPNFFSLVLTAGPGKILHFVGALLSYNIAASYTNLNESNDEVLFIGYEPVEFDTQAGISANIVAKQVLDPSSPSPNDIAIPPQANVANNFLNVYPRYIGSQNRALVLTLLNGPGVPLEGGDPANTVTLDVMYRVVAVSA